MNARKTVMPDLDKVMGIYEKAQNLMIERGNPDQWGHFYPERSTIIDDIEKGISYVLESSGSVAGVFMISEGADPTYSYIEDGAWPDDEEYVTIHRIASSGIEKGVFRAAFEFAKSFGKNIRVDTHEKNRAMQNAVLKCGFKRAGIIYVLDGTRRIAYQWSCNKRV